MIIAKHRVHARWSKPPQVYQSEGRECYLDPIRAKLVNKTKEETVRQTILARLQMYLQVPTDMIDVEASLKHYGINSLLRPDIIINRRVDEKTLEPVAVIECKAEDVPLTDIVISQAEQYADMLGCSYFAISNGHDSSTFAYEPDEDRYVPIDELPRYQEMLAGEMERVDPVHLERFPPLQVWENYRNEYVEMGRIGEDTPPELGIVALNLQDCLIDETHRIPPQKWGRYAITKDLGVRILNVGNSGGGHFIGPYRTLSVLMGQEMKLVSFGFSSYCTDNRPDQDKTALCVALHRQNGPHHSLQLVFENNVEARGTSCLFFHTGRLGVGKGSAPIQGLRDLILERDKALLFGRRFYLGQLTGAKKQILYMDDPEVVELIKNLVSYSIIRDEYRDSLLH